MLPAICVVLHCKFCFGCSKWHADHKLACNEDPNAADGDLTCASLFIALRNCYFSDCDDPATQFDIANAAHESTIMESTTNVVGEEVKLKCSAPGSYPYY